MSGLSRHSGRSFSGYSSSDADSKKPVKFQIQPSKRLTLVQYSDDDSSESAAESQRSHVHKENKLKNQSSKTAKSSSGMSEYDAISSKKMVDSFHQDVHFQAEVERLDVKEKSSVSNLPGYSSAKHHSDEREGRFEDQSPSRKSTDTRQFSNRHKSSYDHRRNDTTVKKASEWDNSPKICDVDQDVIRHTGSSSGSKEKTVSLPILKNCSVKGHHSSKSSNSERFSELLYSVDRKSQEYGSERRETRVEKSQNDVSVSSTIQDRNKTAECNIGQNNSTTERPLKSNETEKQLHKTDKGSKYVKHELEVVSEKNRQAESSRGHQKLSQASEERKSQKEFQYGDTSYAHKHNADHSRHHSTHRTQRESLSQREEVISNKNRSKEKSNLSDISDIKEKADRKLFEGAEIPKISSCNNLDNKLMEQCETSQSTSVQYRHEKEYGKLIISLNTSEISSKEKKLTVPKSDKIKNREVFSNISEKSSYSKSNSSLKEIDTKKIGSNKPKSDRSEISSKCKSDEWRNRTENKNTVKQNCKSIEAKSKKVSKKPIRKSSSESADDSSTSSSEYSSSDEADSSSSSSSSSTSSNENVFEGDKKGKSHHSRKIIQWVEVTKPIIKSVHTHARDNMVVMEKEVFTADCQKKAYHSDSLANTNQAGLDNIVQSERLLADEKSKTSAIKFPEDKQLVSEDIIQSNSAAVTDVLPQNDNVINKKLIKSKTSVDIYSPSAPTGWDVDEKPGNAYGWSSDSDIESSVLELSPGQRPSSLLPLQSEKLARLTHSLECTDLETLERSLIAPGRHGTEVGRTIGSETICDAFCNQPTDKSGQIKDTASDISRVNKTNLKGPPKNDIKYKENCNQESSDFVNKTKDICSVTTPTEDIQSSSAVASTEKVQARCSLDKKRENKESSSSSKGVHQSDSLTFQNFVTVQSNRIARHANQAQPAIRIESDDHNRRKRRDHSSSSVSQERTRRLQSSRSRSPSYERDRRRKRSHRRSRSRDGLSQRREPMLSSRSSSAHQVSNHFSRSKEGRANSHSSDSDDVVILEDYDVLSEKQSCSELAKNSSMACKSNSDTVSPGILDLNSIPLPALLESIPLPVLPDSMVEPVQANDPPAFKDSKISVCATSESVDCMENVDMDLDNSHDSGNLLEIQTDDMDLDNSLTDNVITTECDQSSRNGQSIPPSIRKQPVGDDVATSTIAEVRGAGQIISMRKHTEAVQSQVADISSTTIESPRSADEGLPLSQSLKSPPGKIVLSLNDRIQAKEESLNASTLWKRKLASNLLKPIKFNIPAAITINQTSLSDDDYQSDQSPEVTSVRDSATIPKSFDVCHTTKEKKANVGLEVEQSALSDAAGLAVAVMSPKGEGLMVAHHSDMVRSPDTVLKNIQVISSRDTNAGVPSSNLASRTNVHLSNSFVKSLNVEEDVCGLPITVVGRQQSCEIEKSQVSSENSYLRGKIEIISSSQNIEESHIQSLSGAHRVPLLSTSQTSSKRSTSERKGDLLLPPSNNERREQPFDEEHRSTNNTKGSSNSKTLQTDSAVGCDKSGRESHKQGYHSSSLGAKDNNIPVEKFDSIKRNRTPDSGRRHASFSRRQHSRSPSRTSRDRLEHSNSSSKYKYSESSHSKRNFHERRSRSRSRSESRQKRRRHSSSSERSPSYRRQSDSKTKRIHLSAKHRRSRSLSRKKDDKDSSSKANRSNLPCEQTQSKCSIEESTQSRSGWKNSNESEQIRSRSTSVENEIKLKIDRSNASTERYKRIFLEPKQNKSDDHKDVRKLVSEQVGSLSRLQDDNRNKSLRQEGDRHTTKVHISPDRKRTNNQSNISKVEAVDKTWKEEPSSSRSEKLRLASPAAFITSGMGCTDNRSKNDLSEYKKLHLYNRGKDEQCVDDLDNQKDEMLHHVKQSSSSSKLKSSSHNNFAMNTTCKVDAVNISSRTSSNNEIMGKDVRKATRWERPPTSTDVTPDVKDSILLSANHLSYQQSQSSPSVHHRTSPKSKWSPSRSRFRSSSFEKDNSGTSDKNKIKKPEEQRAEYGIPRSSHRDLRIATSTDKRSKRSSSRERFKLAPSRSRSGSRPRLSRERSYSRELNLERSDERLVNQRKSVYNIESSRQAQRDLKSLDTRASEGSSKLDRSTNYSAEREIQMKLHLVAHDSQSLNTREEQLLPLGKLRPNIRDRSPDYGSLKTSLELHHSVPRENKTSDYYGRRKSPAMRDSVTRNERPLDCSSSTSLSSVMRRTHSGKDKSPEYSSSNVLTSLAKQQSYSRENRSPDYRSRFKSPVKHHSESRGSKYQDYFDDASRSSSLKRRTSPNRDKSPARQRHNSELIHEEKPDDYISRPRSPVRRSPARHQRHSHREDWVDSSGRSFSPMKHQSRSRRGTLPDTSSLSPSRYHQRRVHEETMPSTIGRSSPTKYSGSGEKTLQDHGGSRSQRHLSSGYNDVIRSPNRHISYSPGRKHDVSSPVRYDECPAVSPSMSITSLPDQDIIVNEASDKPIDRCYSSGHKETAVLYSEVVAPQNQGVYPPPVPYAPFPLGTNHPSYQCVAAPSTGVAGWYQLPVTPSPAALPLPGNFSSFSSAWNEPYNSGVVVMPGGPQVQPGVFSQLQTQHPSNSYITPGASQFSAPPVNQSLQPVVGHTINAGVWPPQAANNTFQLAKPSYEELPDSSDKLKVKQSGQTFGEGNPIPVVGCSVTVESPVKKAPSPQWMPLPDRFRDKFRPSFDDRTSKKPHFEEGVIKQVSTSLFTRNDRLSEGATDCTTPNVGAQLNKQLVESEDPRCCCLWEAIPEVLEGMDMTSDTASHFEAGLATQKAKKRPGRHFEDDMGVATIRRRSSRFKPADEVSSNDSEKLITCEVKIENEQREPVSSKSQQSSDDGSDISKQPAENSTTASNDVLKPEKVKSRWRRWSELETDSTAPPPPPPPAAVLSRDVISEEDTNVVDNKLDPVEEKRPYFEEVMDNIFLSSRDMKKSRKEGRNMICDCTPPSTEELARGVLGCSDDCLNRMLMIECGSRCPCGDLCTNKLFQRHQYSKVKCFKTDYKGWGLQADEDLPPGSFIMEYVGEVLDPREFKSRIKKYARENYEHHYFMALNADEVIDATKKGNVSRFVNHCCDPNSETQKWTVNGQLRIGFFTIKPVKAGEELTFDYQFETYGQEATKCYCGASNCRGTIDVGRRSPSKKRGVKLAAKAKEIKRMPGMFSDIFLEEEIEKMSSMGGLRRKDDVLELNRLMLRAESIEHRVALLKALQDTKEPACLRLFLDYHGLALLWSWMVDVTANDFSFKTQVLKTLKLLPIGNKTILRDSRIMAVIEKWANQLTVEKTSTTDLKAAAICNSKTTGDSISDSDAQLSHLSESSSTVCAGAVSERVEMSEYSGEIKDTKDNFVSDGSVASTRCHVPCAVETASSCDEEHVKTEDCENNQVEGISASRDEDNTVVTEEETSDRQAVSTVTDLATHLLSEWATLKEAYKIPKLSVQERKKTEQELDRQCEEHLSRKDPLSSWSRAINRRQAEDSPDLKRRRRDDRGRLSEADDLKTSRIRNLRPIVSTPPSAKSVLSTPPLLSKEERRQQFEAQVRAHDELMQQKVDFEQQQLQHQQPDSTYTDMFATPSASTSFEYPEVQQYSLDAQADHYHVDASTSLVPGTYGSDLITPLQHQLAVANYGSDAALSGTLISGTYSSNIALSAPVGVGDQVAINYGAVPDQAFYGTQPVLQASYQQLTQLPQHDQIHQPSHGYPQPPVVSNDSYSLMIDPLGQGQQYSTQGGVYYAVQGTTLLVQQPIYTPSTQQIVHVPNNRTSTVVSRDPREPPPPPPSPPRHKTLRLPPNWKTAKDSDGKLYYYHSVTRQTQWDPPAWDAGSVEDEEEIMDLGTPTFEETKVSGHRRHTTTTAAADTSSEVAKRLRDQFRSQIAKHIVACLGPYRRPDCEQGRINTTEEFKLLARKLSYAVLTKELKHCRHLEDLEVNENVKGKAKNFVLKYMSRFPGMYRASNNSP